MDGDLRRLAEQRVCARPSDEAEARAALEWLARQEGKPFGQLVAELQAQLVAG